MPVTYFEDPVIAPGLPAGLFPSGRGEDFRRDLSEVISRALSTAEPADAAPIAPDSTAPDLTAGDAIRFQLEKLNAALLEENARVKQQYAEMQENYSVLLQDNTMLRHKIGEVRDDTTDNLASQTNEHDDTTCGCTCENSNTSSNSLPATQSAAIDSSSTTLIVHVPRLADRTAEMLMSDLDLLGFAGQYDYFYSPRDRKGSKGYVFINMTKPVYAQRFFDCVDMLNDPQMESLPLKWLDKTSIVQEARIQGRDQNLRHFWSICKGMWPVHDNVPYVLVDGKMRQELPWDNVAEPPHEESSDTPQTLCLRGIPKRVGPVDMMEVLDKNGFDGTYSYFFMPCDVRSLNHRGYAFVHLDTQELARRFIARMNGYAFNGEDSRWLMRVTLAKHQGVVANLEKSKTIKYSGSLLYYPWVRVDGEMTCVSTEDELRACLQDLKGDTAESSISTEASTDDC
jgi:hypothetical protein